MTILWLYYDYTIYANQVLIKTTMSNKRYWTHYKIWGDLDTFGSDSIFVKNVFMWSKNSAVMY